MQSSVYPGPDARIEGRTETQRATPPWLASGSAVDVTVTRPDAAIALVEAGAGVIQIAGLVEVAVEVDVAARAGRGEVRRAAL